MTTFKEERLKDIWNEFMALANAHWVDTEEYQKGEIFRPDKNRYCHFNDIGYLRVYTARDDGRLIGYAGMYVTRNMHTQEMLSSEDYWFLEDNYRRTRTSVRFYHFVEQSLIDLGVTTITMTVSLNNASQASQLLEKLGYRHVSSSYTKQFKRHINEQTRSAATA